MGQEAKAGGVYAFYIEELKKYGAIQVIDTNNNSTCYITLDYLGEEVPQTSVLKNLEPFYKDCYCNRHIKVKQVIDRTDVPGNYIFAGIWPLVESDRDKAFFDDTWTQGECYIFEERWNLASEDARKNYKKYVNNVGFTNIKGKLFKNNTWCLDNELYKLFDENASLSVFPCLTSADICGYFPKLKNLIKTSPFLHSLKLDKPEAQTVDLTGTGLYNIATDITGVKKLLLPEETFQLTIYGSLKEELVVYGNPVLKDKGIILHISLKDFNLPCIIYKDIKIRELWINDAREIDTGLIADKFPYIKKLYITGCPGIITNMHKIENLKSLQSVGFYDIFGYNGTDIQVLTTLKELREIELDSVPKDAGRYVKEHFKGVTDTLYVKNLRGSRWLSENIDNPLRSWDGSRYVPYEAYKKALKCYKDTRILLKEAENNEDVAETARQFTRTFNALNKKYREFIGTCEREDIFKAMGQLYNVCIQGTEKENWITLEEIWDIMDETRKNW